jgi:hypothetical protein
MALALPRQADCRLDRAAVEALRKALRGALLQPADPEYDEARTIWNAMIARRPALIARVSGSADVVACVNFARENGLPLSVRGGGHNVAGAALCDGGLMIDMSLRRAVRLDPVRRVVRVEGGATWGDVDHETQPFGLVVPSGIVSKTGVARVHHGRRLRLDLPQVRLCGGQPAVGRHRHRRRRASLRQCDGKS